ncbi:putative mRNA export protein mlo3 [Sphaerosporella brunnea]|uniref:Putative mRNA export protein mlo3 n=1 Tax=Sphaerosporella brunnea TaxID=1250544 RepID=A0A5J5EMT2_9PEZI|nr:putative mRNA export protein mlo3 [Sphaerosporella brunnea]
MSSKLDRSLDEILAASRPARRGAKAGTPTGPSGGIRKRSQRVAAQKANASVAQNAAKTATKSIPTGPSGKLSASKIIVSNLPFDVSEGMIKEYFQSVVGPIRRAILTYGPNGQSRGVATVEFVKPEHAATAAQRYNGVEVDNRPMKVELVVDPNAPPSFADRVGAPNKIVTTTKSKADKPKPAAKPATAPRARGNSARGGKRGGGRAGNASRPKPKTAEQLDQEMADYFGESNNNTAAPAANGGDVGMDDDTVLVGAP